MEVKMGISILMQHITELIQSNENVRKFTFSIEMYDGRKIENILTKTEKAG